MISANSITFKYGVETLIDDLSFTANPGEIIGVIGPNGAGKSTLLKLIAKLLLPQKGEILINHKDISDFSSKDVGKTIAVVHQQFNPTFFYSVEEVVSMGRYVHSNSFGFDTQNAAVLKAIEDTGISSLRKRNINTLSGGELQLTFLARALAQETPIILLDEATSNLDITHTVRLLKTIKKRAQEKGTSVVAVIHDLNLALNYTDKIIMLKKGQSLGPLPSEKVFTDENIENFFEIASKEFTIDKDKKWLSLNF